MVQLHKEVTGELGKPFKLEDNFPSRGKGRINELDESGLVVREFGSVNAAIRHEIALRTDEKYSSPVCSSKVIFLKKKTN